MRHERVDHSQLLESGPLLPGSLYCTLSTSKCPRVGARNVDEWNAREGVGKKTGIFEMLQAAGCDFYLFLEPCAKLQALCMQMLARCNSYSAFLNNG